MIGIINYRAGNGPSVQYALERLKAPSRLIATAEEIADCDKIILPGVGSAGATMDSLRELAILETLEHRVLNEKIPFLGICVGLQVLFEDSQEGDVTCLGWIKGHTLRFPDRPNPVPQIGWNEVRFQHEHPVLSQLPSVGHFYFVNSYYVAPDDPAVALGKTDYGVDFCSVVADGNIIATQFHVEKSGPLGLRLLKNFTEMESGATC